jgi:hypothetical protein
MTVDSMALNVLPEFTTITTTTTTTIIMNLEISIQKSSECCHKVHIHNTDSIQNMVSRRY